MPVLLSAEKIARSVPQFELVYRLACRAMRMTAGRPRAHLDRAGDRHRPERPVDPQASTDPRHRRTGRMVSSVYAARIEYLQH